MTKARKWLQNNAPGSQLGVENWAWEKFPEEETCWNLKTEGGRNQLERYPQALSPTKGKKRG